jgi:hypothetical protein
VSQGKKKKKKKKKKKTFFTRFQMGFYLHVFLCNYACIFQMGNLFLETGLKLFSDFVFHVFFLSPIFCFKTGTQTHGYSDKNDFAVLETEHPFPKRQPNIPLFSYIHHLKFIEICLRKSHPASIVLDKQATWSHPAEM